MASFHLIIFLCFASATFSMAHGDLDYSIYRTVLYSDVLKCALNKSLVLDVSRLKLYLYDFEKEVNSSYYLDEAAGQILTSSAFDPTRRMLFYVHAFTLSANSILSDKVRQDLKHVPNSYIFFVDHSEYTYLSNNLDLISSYNRAVKYYWDIGRAIAEFLIDFVDRGVAVDLIHLMGHSLGAHIVAAAGEHYYNTTGELLPRVTGIDPAGPCFSEADKKYQIRSGIAQHVESYHCDADELGTNRDLSDVNFYVNGGQNQPGCIEMPIGDFIGTATASVCSHLICPLIFTFSVRQKHIYQAVKCDSYSHFRDGACSTHDSTIAGYYSPSNVTGIYYFDTNWWQNKPLLRILP